MDNDPATNLYGCTANFGHPIRSWLAPLGATPSQQLFGSFRVKHTLLLRRLTAGATGLAIGTVGALALASPAQATIDPPVEPSVEFENACEGTLVTLNSGSELDEYRWTIWHEGGEGALLPDLGPEETEL
jgi:hypothetical protein